jgi:hypothetical protein
MPLRRGIKRAILRLRADALVRAASVHLLHGLGRRAANPAPNPEALAFQDMTGLPGLR